MSKLDDLINKFCPDGVEFKRLGECIYSLNTGLNPRQFFQLNTDDAKNYYVTIREIINGKIVFSKSTDRINDEAMLLCNNRSNLEKGDVLFSGTGTIGRTCVLKETPKNWNIKEGVYTIKPNQNVILSKYLSYCLQSTEVRIAYMSKSAGGTVQSVPMKEMKNLEIPVPPLEIQNEIVRILDNFTELEEELEEELVARRKQYEYYRDSLLTFDDNVEWKKLGDIATRIKGTPITATQMKLIAADNGEIKIFAGGKTVVNAHESDIPNANITKVPAVLVQSRGTIDFVYYDKPFTFKNEMWAYTFENQITVKYIYYVLKNNVEHFRKITESMGAFPQIALPDTEKYKVPLPDIKAQEKIVNILDRFEALCNDITSGLPAEIEARHKQYEYYRDKLLTFKRKSA